MLLKSCATPPVNWPTASIFCASCSSCCAFFCAVTSALMLPMPKTWPWLSIIGNLVTTKSCSLPSAKETVMSSLMTLPDSTTCRSLAAWKSAIFFRAKIVGGLAQHFSFGQAVAGQEIPVGKLQPALRILENDRIWRVLDNAANPLLAVAKRRLGSFLLGHVLGDARDAVDLAVGVAHGEGPVPDQPNRPVRTNHAVFRIVGALRLPSKVVNDLGVVVPGGWTSQARPHLPQAHQQQLSSQNYRSCSGPPWTLRLSQFCVQGNRVRLTAKYGFSAQ